MQRHRFSRSGMRQVISLASPQSSSFSDNCQSSDAEEYQVDTCSTSSSKDYQDEEDGAVVASDRPDLPSFGSVSVVNSNDVHFGNKTVYQGPVTIKQFVYPGAGDSVSAGLTEGAIFPNGVDNVGFCGDGSCKKDVEDTAVPEERPAQAFPGVRKGLQWLRNLPAYHTKSIMIIISIVIVSVTITLTVVYGKLPGIGSKLPEGDTNELDENSEEFTPDFNTTETQRPQIISRIQWVAQPSMKPLTPLRTPISLVIIHDTSTESCTKKADCIFTIRYIQVNHVEGKNLWDIAYNFMIGGDSLVYEGRGWKKEGAHTFDYNSKSLGVAFVGSFGSSAPPQNQTEVFEQLMELGVEKGYISKDYKIMAARQLESIESPGKAFYEVIKTWPRWSRVP